MEDDVGGARADVEEAAARWPDRGAFMTAVIESYAGNPEAVLEHLGVAIPALRRARKDARAIDASGMEWSRASSRMPTCGRSPQPSADASATPKEADHVLRRCGASAPERMVDLLTPAFIGA